MGWLLPVGKNEVGSDEDQKFSTRLEQGKLAVVARSVSECSWDRHAVINPHSSGTRWVIVHFGKGLHDMAEDCVAQEVHSKLCAAQTGTAVTANGSPWHILRLRKE